MNRKTLLFLSGFIITTSLLSARDIKENFLLKESMLKDLSWYDNRYLEINENWKYHAGDTDEAIVKWTSRDLDDKNWENVNSFLSLDSLPVSGWNGIGWFRLHLEIDTTLLNKPLALNVIHAGASEVYLDGKLFARFGTVGKSRKDEIGFNSLTLMPQLVIFTQPEHILAVRYSGFNVMQNRPPTVRQLGFSLEIGNPDEVNKTVLSHGTFFRPLESLVIAIPITFALIHFILFLFYRREKSNLYFALFAATFALWGILEHEAVGNTHAVWSLLLKRLWLPYLALMPVTGLRFLYSLFYKRIPKQFWFFLIASAGFAIWSWFAVIPLLSLILFILSLGEMIRIIIVAMRKKIPGSWIIGVGFAAFCVSWVLLIVILITNHYSLFLWYILIYLTGVLPVMLSMSVYLSQRVAGTYKSLETEMKKTMDLQLENARKETELLKATELKAAYQALENAHANLKATQAQLIQSEKMASLGELTAGIAHEIQNPLNFVNNFSELNSELVKEIKQELAIGNEQLAKGEIEKTKIHLKNAIEVSHDIETNSEKINHHGKRAESIVKGMLEHSRKSTGVKEPTDINKLCDEFLRLSYHGLRAKDKDFNCDYKLDFDPNLPLVKVVSQDIGRVILNIVNNAFQACFQQSEILKSESQVEYKPLISISTNYVASPRRCVSISISDNGPGIPDSIKEKIFQPFFTTKPTGQGTGLGLSLSYDIVKAHGGVLKVETKENEGSTFIIQLPFQ